MSAKRSDVVYDVIVVGGGPMGLSAAYQCAAKEHKKVIVVEKYTFGNSYGSSPGFGRQFRTCYSEYNLCELAIKTSLLWDELMDDLDDQSLLKRTGVLWFGDAKVEGSEGNIDKAVQNLKDLQQQYTLLEDKEEILNDERFSFVSHAVNDIAKPKALYLEDGGTINVPALVKSLLKKLEETETVVLLENAIVECIDYSSQDVVKVSVVSDQEQQLIRGKKVIMTPGVNVNRLLETLKPSFTKRINLLIYLWSSTYFKSKTTSSQKPGTPSESSEWPVWFFFGQPDDKGIEEAHNVNVFYGFPSEKMKPRYARVAPAFTSSHIYDLKIYPPSISSRPLDSDALRFTSAFVEKSMPSLSSTLVEDEFSTCLAGFAELVSGSKEDDQSAGFVLDFLPGEEINNRLVVFTGGWGMKFVPVIGKILADLAIRGRTEYNKLIEPMNINRGILVEEKDISQKKPGQKLVRLPISGRAAKFNKIWS